MKRGWNGGVAVAVVYGTLCVLVAPACEGLGLGGEGGGACSEAAEGGGAGEPICNIAAQGPCYERCQSEYDDAALQCGAIEIEVARKACQDDAHDAYKQCRAGCAANPVEQCKKLCDKENEKCVAKCPKGDKGCMNDCNQQYGKCLKDCER